VTSMDIAAGLFLSRPTLRLRTRRAGSGGGLAFPELSTKLNGPLAYPPQKELKEVAYDLYLCFCFGMSSTRGGGKPTTFVLQGQPSLSSPLFKNWRLHFGHGAETWASGKGITQC